jgi:hypothetical protein
MLIDVKEVVMMKEDNWHNHSSLLQIGSGIYIGTLLRFGGSYGVDGSIDRVDYGAKQWEVICIGVCVGICW